MGYAIRAGGGFSELGAWNLNDRFIVDQFYFMIVVLVLLNIFFGIIIDTFGELRALKNERDEDTTTICFICGIDNQTFDRASPTPRGFQDHITADHNMWNYFYYIVYIEEQDKDDDDGLEQYVRRCIEANDINWFPVNAALKLETSAAGDELLKKMLQSEVKKNEEALMNKLLQFQLDVSTICNNLANDLIPADDVEEKQPETNGVPRFDTVEYGELKGIAASDARFFQINLMVSSFTGITFSAKDAENVSCRFLSEGGMHEVKSVTQGEKETISFEPLQFTACEQAVPDDERSVRFQLLLGGISRVAKFLGAGDALYTDLIHSSGLELEVELRSTEDEHLGYLYVVATCLSMKEDRLRELAGKRDENYRSQDSDETS